MKKALQICLSIIIGLSVFGYLYFTEECNFKDTGNDRCDVFYEGITFPKRKSDAVLAFVNATPDNVELLKKNGYSESFCTKWKSFYEKCRDHGEVYDQEVCTHLADDLAAMTAALEEETGLSHKKSKQIVSARAREIHRIHSKEVFVDFVPDMSGIRLKGGDNQGAGGDGEGAPSAASLLNKQGAAPKPGVIAH